jgi:high-affinity iron transporter
MNSAIFVKPSKIRLWVLLLLPVVLFSFLAIPVQAASPEEELQQLNTSVETALSLAKSGDLAAAQQAYKTFESSWSTVEDGVKEKSRQTYLDIENKMRDITEAFAAQNADKVAETLDNLYDINIAFIQSNASGNSATAVDSTPTVSTVLGKLDDARNYVISGNYASALNEVKEFQVAWLDVEGQIKTRSVEAYTGTENDMSLAFNLLSQNSPQAKEVLDRMYARLEPFNNAGNYGIFDAVAIILREGLEALLVLVALLAFLRKSDNKSGQKWVWSGAIGGLGISIMLAVLIQLIFTSAFSGGNREVMEGFVGLFAAAMLVYVSYWLHSKSNIKEWQRYISAKTSNALAKGSLFGLALLAFLAVFREGAETVLFLLGMAGAISLFDLLVGLGIGLAIMLVIGILIMVVGVRIPLRPFFMVASILVFYLCFKFLGTGIHSLQVANVISSNTNTFLPASDFFGIFPTWETTIPQLLLLSAGVGVWFAGIRRSRLNTLKHASIQASK